VVHAPYPDPYRRPDGLTAEEHALQAAEYIEKQIFATVSPKNEVAAIVVEPVQGEGGYIFPHAVFLRELRRIADDSGALLVFDEVQSGMGRTGRMWASEHSGVEPDIIASAKGIASGMPLGATIAADHIMDWPPGAHGSTFGGNPVAIAAALETIALLEEELIANAERIGRHILSRIENWRERFKPVGQVRGLGLMIGIELVADKTSKDPAPELRDRLVQQAFHRGLLVLGCGKSTIRISPPLMISQEQADFAMDVLEQILRDEAG
jgi:4-aminobutyrate aminotransferase